MKLRAALVLACACSAAPPLAPAPLPTPTPLVRPTPDAAPEPVAAAPAACLRDADTVDVSFLEGDKHTIDICFTTNACFTIERRTSRITTRTTPSVILSRVTHRTQPVAIETVNADVVNVCLGDVCTQAFRREAARLAGGRGDVAANHMVITVGGEGTADAQFFGIDLMTRHVTELPIVASAPCADATWLEENILVSSDDCAGGSARSTLYDSNGSPIVQLGLDLRDATTLHRDTTLAILAPRAYALVLTDATLQPHSIIDLVPIQTESTPTPHFQVARLDEDDWLVASATGGVGIVDHTTATLTKTWIIPRCAADAPTGP